MRLLAVVHTLEYRARHRQGQKHKKDPVTLRWDFDI
jgi:hypothetical protein